MKTQQEGRRNCYYFYIILFLNTEGFTNLDFSEPEQLLNGAFWAAYNVHGAPSEFTVVRLFCCC